MKVGNKCSEEVNRDLSPYQYCMPVKMKGNVCSFEDVGKSLKNIVKICITIALARAVIKRPYYVAC